MVAVWATRDLIPLYGLYALYFSDHGLSTGEISSLLVIWSVTGFLLEIPSGAWADTVDRRALLVLGGGVYAAAFSSWMLWPTYAGIALGFVLWGASGAVMSGTFEALVHDELTARGEADGYAQLIGWSHSAAMAANVLATLAAAPLFAWGGYAVVGWTSVGVALLHTLLATRLPAAPAVADVAEEPAGRYLAMLRTGLREALRHRRVRGGVVVVALVLGCSAYDEYFGLVVRDHGAAIAQVPLVVGVIGVGELIGTALAGRTARMSARTMALLVALSAAAISAGALAGPLWAVAALIGVGYGVLDNAMVVAEARLQAVISGPARATVTSVSAISMEVVALSVYGFMALGTTWWSTATVLALWGVPVLGIALVTWRLLPEVAPVSDRSAPGARRDHARRTDGRA